MRSLVGMALASLKRPREQVVVATKLRIRTGPGANQVGLSRSHVFAAVDASLSRLKLDFIDLYQIHGVDFDTPIEETIVALNDDDTVVVRVKPDGVKLQMARGSVASLVNPEAKS